MSDNQEPGTRKSLSFSFIQ